MEAKLSHYRLLEQIGAGGMGVVFRAHDERLDRDVALKVLPEGALANDAARKRFRKEALALSKLNHPNIATVHDFDSENGADFLVEELIEGLSLHTMLLSGPLSEREVITLGSQLCDGLAAAHERGVIHCDLKPGNILVTPDARLKILDFGLAKVLHTAAAANDIAATASVTESQTLSGTAPYMAPEQLLNQDLGPGTDIWATGCVLYEMATGRRPFPGAGPALTDAILHQQAPAASQLNPKLSPGLEAIILKCLEKDRALRYQSVKELMVDLRRLQAGVPSAVQPAVRPVGRSFTKWVGLGLGTLALVIVLLVVFKIVNWRDRLFGRTDGPRIESLAVLPLANLSGNPESEYFADGMTEELITNLGKVGAVRVISRTSVMQYRQTKKALPTIARELNVDAVVEGSVLRSGNRVRITAQLIQAREERQLWAESYERDISDILALQADVARDIAERIRIKLVGHEPKRLASTRSVDVAAYEAYLRGRYYWNKRSREGMLRGLQYFQEAVKLDPTYALAYVGVADSYSVLLLFHWLSPGEAIPPARAAALKALSLDETLAEAHTSMALVTQSDWDWVTAEREYRRALELNPNYATARHWYSILLSEMGRHEEAVVQARRAAESDPLSLMVLNNVGVMLYMDRRYDEALQFYAKVIATDPRFMTAWYCAGQAYVQTGRFDEGIAALKRAASLSPRDDLVLSTLVFAYGRAGRKAEARKVLDEWKNLSRDRYLSGYLLAQSYVGLGENEKAMHLLEKAYQERDTLLGSIGTDPMFDPLRSDPRFQDLLRRINLPQSAPSS